MNFVVTIENYAINNFGFYDKRTIFIFRITHIIRKVLA